MNSAQNNDSKWMQYAIGLAEKAWGNTHPNPMVGSVLVDANDQILSEGFHAKAGELHAERAALTHIELSQAQKATSTLYVTLEPCCTHGRTPPCTEIILEKGIKRVVVGAIDPNPNHAGTGIDILRDAGVEVITGICAKACEDLNLIFHHRMKTGNPLIAVKTAVTLDGKIATRTGKSKWITSTEARQNVMHWRRYFPAIAVGAGTAIADDPSLSIREPNLPVDCPTRFIFDRSFKTFDFLEKLQIYNDAWKDRTIVITSKDVASVKINAFQQHGITILPLDYNSTQLAFSQFLEYCKQQSIGGVYIEGGCQLVSEILKLNQANYLYHYQAPKLFGASDAPSFVDDLQIDDPNTAPHLNDPVHEIVGNDILTRGFFSYN